MKPKIGIIGEYYDNFVPHTSLNKALEYLNEEYRFDFEWIETEHVEKEKARILKNYTGIWSAPGSPFKGLDGALYAITYARLNDIPHLGTCAGFQHMLLLKLQGIYLVLKMHSMRNMKLNHRLYLLINWSARLQERLWMSI